MAWTALVGRHARAAQFSGHRTPEGRAAANWQSYGAPGVLHRTNSGIHGSVVGSNDDWISDSRTARDCELLSVTQRTGVNTAAYRAKMSVGTSAAGVAGNIALPGRSQTIEKRPSSCGGTYMTGASFIIAFTQPTGGGPLAGRP